MAKEIEYKFYHYSPTVVGAAIFAVLFFVSSAHHAYIIVRTKTWYFIPFLVGGISE